MLTTTYFDLFVPPPLTISMYYCKLSGLKLLNHPDIWTNGTIFLHINNTLQYWCNSHGEICHRGSKQWRGKRGREFPPDGSHALESSKPKHNSSHASSSVQSIDWPVPQVLSKYSTKPWRHRIPRQPETCWRGNQEFWCPPSSMLQMDEEYVLPWQGRSLYQVKRYWRR